ncbi:MAG: hypothetical protein J6031_00345 [Bacteroidales bacterium]|nr:hypothetical protein [Bacteroidales bacterium]
MDSEAKTGARGRLGCLATIVATVALIALFWGPSWLTHWNILFFSTSSEDLIKDVFTTTYHVAHDDDMAISNAMNYPYGEYYTFTGLHPLVAAPLQWLRKAGVVHTERAVLPLMNLLSLLSVVLCALFLYLILRELKLPIWYSVVVALLITLMSPQLQRMGAHMSLSYYCAIPMLLYFTLRHLRSGAWGWALAIGVSMLWFALCHPYYLVFYTVVTVGELAYVFFRRRNIEWCKDKAWRKISIAALVELVLPLGVFYILSHVGVPDGERTAVPSGFFTYQGRIEGILFPYGRPYFYEDSHLFARVKWEARNYVGIVAVVAIVLMVCCFFRNLVKKCYASLLRPTDSRELNLFLLIATVLMLYACGVPFNWFSRNVVAYIGPLAQFRTQGRFVWLFVYVINIVAFYGLFRWMQSNPKALRKVVLVVALVVMAAEATAYNWHNKAWYSNQWAEWTDYDNKLPQNQWVNDIDTSKYQAILTLPVFNEGSEIAYLPSQDRMFARSALLSMKTGLPLVCNESARSNIRQAWDCIALSRTAFDFLRLADSLPDDRLLLLAVTKNKELLSDAERMILSYADTLMMLNDIELYSLHPDVLRIVRMQTSDELETLYDTASTDGFDYRSAALVVPDTVKGNIHSRITVYDGPLSLSGDVEISFWMSPILDDQYSRSDIKVYAANDDKESQLFSWCANVLLDIVDINHNEGLLRLTTTLPDNCSRLRIEMRNRQMRPSLVMFHHLLVRPEGMHIPYCDGQRYIDNIPLKDEIIRIKER